MNRAKRFMHNSLSTALSQVCLLAYGFIVPRLVMACYGSEVNGLVSSVNQIMTYLSLVEAGLAGATVLALYEPLAKQDTKSINGIISAARLFYLQAGYIFSGLVVLAAAIYPALKPISHMSHWAMTALILALGAKSAFEFFTLAKYRALLTADQKTYVISNASSVYTLISLGIVVLLCLLRCHITLIHTAAIFALCARALILVRYVNKHYTGLNFGVKPNTKALNTRWDAFYLQVLGAAQMGWPLVLATIFFGFADVSVYSVYHTTLMGINSVLSIFTSGLSASFGDIIARRETKALQRAAATFEFSYYFLITVVYSVAYTTLMSFVKLYTAGITDANYSRPLLGALVVINGFLYNLKTPQGMLVISAGHYRETRWRSTMQTLLLIGLGFAFTPWMGLCGIALGSCLSNLYRDIDLAVYIPQHVTHTLPRKTLLRMLWATLTSVACVLLCNELLADRVASYGGWALFAVKNCLVAFGVTALSAVFFQNAELRSLLRLLQTIFALHIKERR